MSKGVAFAILISIFAPLFVASGESASTPGYLSQRVTVSFVPEDVFFLVETPSGTVQRMRAAIVPLNADAGKYIVGVKLKEVSNPEKVFYSVLILGKGNQFESIPLTSYASALEGIPQGSSEALEDYLASRKEVLSSYNLQVQSQEASLRRLRQDADVIGNFGRVMETSDEIERLKMDISNADKSAQTMETLIRLASTMPAPKNAIARETQLTMQLGELAQAAKNAEAAEMSRKAGMEADLRQKLAVVESSRFEDYDALQRQLDELRSQREALEKQRGVSAAPSAVPGTALPVSPDVEY